jgi:glutathione peroxidase
MLFNLFRLAFLLAVVVVVYALWTHRSKRDMSARQKILLVVYPWLMQAGQIFGKPTQVQNRALAQPSVSLYDLSYQTIDGKTESMRRWQGKKILIVNTASDCGYTGQYAELQTLQTQFAERLVIIGFPSNDFKEQEKGDNASIAAFCQRNYGVQFPLAAKSIVLKKSGQDPIFQWLTNPSKNGWCQQEPAWNFCKYLINEQGVLTHYFDTKISPLDASVINALQEGKK